ncbi:MAG: ORF6N domain-containing protein [Nanoarchaeota archaeon]|nr:ORF6N domain-containing protein [Nanoarchaeota archaeon]MBU1321669.1 ORF6N domain-containing protein [Nanoarchaeota archaeon]MBU1598419.1 ORF6N domain-containing protein [Nanoarchaeota archaeon]MBU2441045.1 ORF6N domain-containing protein [Nanoarchaeota archaeon]
MQIKDKIHTIRGEQVILDSDLAEMYEVKTKALNQAVKRNKERFPSDFMFILTHNEVESMVSQSVIPSNKVLRSQFVTSSSKHGGRRNLPYAFTEQGVSMLSAVIRSETAVKVSIQIMNAFVAMRKFIASNAGFFQRLDRVEIKQIEQDKKFEKVFEAIEAKEIKPSKGIFFDGQVFDAHKFVSDLIRKAEKRIILIDNYIDEDVLMLISKKKKDIEATIYTRKITDQLKLSLKKLNEQYKNISVKEFNKSHDRFLLIDDDVYHFGASLKDLGKKWFAFSKFNKKALEILEKCE